MLKIKDYYELLGVSKDATDSDLKKGYRKMALQFHPDKTNVPGADEAFKLIGYAYAVLSNAEKRKQYDKKESVIGISSYEPNQLKKLETRYKYHSRLKMKFQFHSWNNWRKDDGFMCRDTNDCNWIDKNLYCQSYKELQPIVSYSAILISLWSVLE